EEGECDRQVEPRPLLAQIRGREIDGDAALRPLELGGGDAAANAMLRLLAGAVGEPDDCEPGHPALQVSFDFDATRVEPDERMRDRACEHVATVGDQSPHVCDKSRTSRPQGARRPTRRALLRNRYPVTGT